MSKISESKKNYFEFLENVLGIKSVIQESALNKAQFPNTEILFCVESYYTYTSEETELLHKMVGALKLDFSRVMICDLTEKELRVKKISVIFRDQPSKARPGATNVVETYSPRALLKKPEFKKNAWDELQKVIQLLA